MVDLILTGWERTQLVALFTVLHGTPAEMRVTVAIRNKCAVATGEADALAISLTPVEFAMLKSAALRSNRWPPNNKTVAFADKIESVQEAT
jgi:hypothetical protein